jgi:hypothetical protein
MLYTEPGHNFISGPKYVDGLSFKNIMGFSGDLLQRPSEYAEYNTVTIDTADGLVSKATSYICAKEGVKFIQDIPHGKGWDMLSAILRTIIGSIIESGKAVCFTSHKQTIENKFSTGTSNEIKPELNKRARKEILGFVDFIGYMYIGPIGESGGKRVTGHLLNFCSNEDVETKNRGGVFTKPVVIEPEEQSYQKFVDAYNNGTDKYKENTDG